MAEGLVTDLIKQLASIAVREAEQEIRSVIGVDKNIKKLENNLRTVKAVLNDAEKRQVREEAVKLWLEKLKDACYEMDDVVDEWNTAMIKSEIQKHEEENAENALAVMKKVCSFIPSPSCCFRQVDKLVLRCNIAHKIKEVNGKLDEVVRERERFQFHESNRVNAPEVVGRPLTTSFVDVSELCGRDTIKVDLVKILLGRGSEEERSPHVISLVGMGGIGKTALAQLAYNDPEVQAYFDIKIWICISDPFDQCRVAKAILEAILEALKHDDPDNAKAILKTLGDGYPNNTELQSLIGKIYRLIERKKFFLVLDDVWTEDSALWEPFECALRNGAQGSRILATTRKSRVAEMMGSLKTSESMINLEMLSENDCWLVFRKIAFFDRDPNQCEQLEDLGRNIAKKCKGLPLAAKTLGSLMRFQRSREEWEMVLGSSLWELEDVGRVVEKDLFGPLLLSYNDLPSTLKQCFSFCSVFPKDYVFDIDDLIYMWMAHGYIHSKEHMELKGREYLENLAIRSFFQDFEKDEDDGQIRGCKMHDIVHDFAQLMTKDECFTINSDTKLGLDYKNARHLRLERLEEGQFPVSVYNAKNLRTLIIKDLWDDNLFQHFRYLRSLTLDCLSRNIPDTLENCIHLRYLNLRNLAYMPKTINNLCNLQILKIEVRNNVYLKFPHGIGKPINLRHLILEKDGVYGFGRLTSLRRLSHFYVSGTQDGCKLGELKDLNQLQGSLDINGLGYVVDVCEVENAHLKKKIHLHTLKLQFNSELGDDRRRIENDVSVLNALEPPPNLKYLSIFWYEGTTMSPNWMMSLTKLKTLHLYDFFYLEHLPPLGKLPVLESLKITRFESLRKVGVEFLGIESENKKEDNMQIFPNLKSLKFEYLTRWEEWIGIGGMREEEVDSNITIMPRLQRLVIDNCRSLFSLPDFLRTIPLKELEIDSISNCKELRQRWIGEKWRMISRIPNIKIGGEYVQRDGQEVKSEFDWHMLRDNEEESDEEESNEEEEDEEEHAEEEFDKEASSSTMNLHD